MISLSRLVHGILPLTGSNLILVIEALLLLLVPVPSLQSHSPGVTPKAQFSVHFFFHSTLLQPRLGRVRDIRHPRVFQGQNNKQNGVSGSQLWLSPVTKINTAKPKDIH